MFRSTQPLVRLAFVVVVSADLATAKRVKFTEQIGINTKQGKGSGSRSSRSSRSTSMSSGNRGGGGGGGCFPDSQTIVSGDGTPLKVSYLTKGFTVLAMATTLSEGLTNRTTQNLFIGWAYKLADAEVAFKEISCGIRKVRLTGDHFVLARKTLEADVETMPAQNLNVGYFLPVLTIEEKTRFLSWGSVTAIEDVLDRGLYQPLVSPSETIVTGSGIVVPLMSLSHSDTTQDVEDIVTPREAEVVYESWVAHWLDISVTYPCLLQYRGESHQVVVTDMMKHYFDQHPHNVSEAVDPYHFMEWLKKDPEAVVGPEYAVKMKSACPHLRT